MSGNRPQPRRGDRRAVRTRAAIVGAYSELIRQRRQQQIKVADIVARADVGRSTFYEHFASADAVFLEAVARPLSVLADAAAGHADAARLEGLLNHFWDNRQRAREMLSGRQGERVERLLAELIECRLAGGLLVLPPRLVAAQLAGAGLAPIRAWLMAEAACPPDRLAAAICAGADAVMAALRT